MTAQKSCMARMNSGRRMPRERAAGIVVRRAAEIEMGGHALGQAIPQGEAEKHRQQDDDAGNEQGAFRNGFHGCLLSVERARA